MRYRMSVLKMSEIAGGLPWRFICFRHLGIESKVEIEAVIGEVGNNPTSSVPEQQPIVESEVSQG